MLSDEWLSRYGLLENFNASVTRTRTGTRTGTWTTGVTAIALCTSCSRAKNDSNAQRLTLVIMKAIQPSISLISLLAGILTLNENVIYDQLSLENCYNFS